MPSAGQCLDGKIREPTKTTGIGMFTVKLVTDVFFDGKTRVSFGNDGENKKVEKT